MKGQRFRIKGKGRVVDWVVDESSGEAFTPEASCPIKIKIEDGFLHANRSYGDDVVDIPIAIVAAILRIEGYRVEPPIDVEVVA